MAKIVNPYIVLVKGGEPTPPTPPTPPTEVKYLVQVIDYDGTVLKSAKLNTGDTFTLPDAPTGRPRLTFQEWSSPVAITNNTITVGDSDITIGATYTTTSGLTEFDITLTEVTGLTVTCKMAGNKNWGDGTSDATTSHTYSATGNYTITCDGTKIPGYVMGQSSSTINYTLVRTRISSSVTIITYGGFQNCRSITSITIPNSVTSIESNAVNNCYSLTSITIPNGVTSLGSFGSCYSLTSITIPNSVTSLSSFSNCYSLTSITIPNGVTSIGVGVFQNCHSLTSITIPNSVTSIKSGVFQNCYSIKSITIPNGVTSLDINVFNACNSLTSMTIPNSVTSIGKNAFLNCRSLIKYDFSTFTSVPTLNDTTAFSGINGICKMLIPSALIDTWKTATNWSTYAQYMVAV